MPIIILSVIWIFSFSSFQICRSKVTVKVTKVNNFGMNRKALSQGMYMLNIKALPLIVQKLRQMFKFSDM